MYGYLNKIFLFLLLIFLFGLGCSNKPRAELSRPKGIVHGKVTIGPMRPIQTQGQPAPKLSKWYKGKKILIYTLDKKTLIAATELDENGNYQLVLEPGIYIMDMKRAGIEQSPHLPKKIEIKPGQTLRVDIDIDTGIR
jgi:hypothetical protein